MRLTAAYVETRDGWIAADIMEAKGIHTQGRTLEEARTNLYDALGAMLEEAPHQVGVPTKRKPPRGSMVESIIVIRSPA